jgi:hypothetical protein
MSNQDSYELKAQALNNDPRLKEAGITALKFTADGQYIMDGELSSDLPSETAAPKPDAKVRVVLRAPRELTYELIARHLNNDPALARAGIAGIGLSKGGGVVPAVEAPLPKTKRSLVPSVVIAVLAALILIGGAGALFLSSPPEPTPAPTATTVAIIPVTGEPTDTDTPVPATETPVPPTATQVSTKTAPPTATYTSSPTPTVLACLPPSEVVVAAENLSCRYGPGAAYLYTSGLLKGDVVDVLGRADSAYGTWIYVKTRWETRSNAG